MDVQTLRDTQLEHGRRLERIEARLDRMEARLDSLQVALGAIADVLERLERRS